jgi:hypothetical protein
MALTNPELNFTAPEFCLRETALSPAADLFSLGVLVHAVFAKGHASVFEARCSLNQYRRCVDEVSVLNIRIIIIRNYKKYMNIQ